jgi:Zinc-finger of the MIZ type in Nse subunit
MEAPSITLADTLLRSIRSKQEQYTADIKKNSALLKLVADRFTTLPPALAESMNDELVSVLEAQKTVVRSLAKDNVEREQYVHTFCKAVETIRERTGRGDFSVFGASADPDLLPLDYQKAIEDTMAFHASNQPAVDLYDNELYSEIVDTMGDPKPNVTDSQKKKKPQRGRGSRPEDDEEDDDIEVMRNVETQASGSANVTAALRCPISREFMTDAVQNTQCHHIYSRAGITGYMHQSQATGYRGRAVKCPVFGCMNGNVTADQLIDHYETSRQAQKEVRLQSQRKALQNQANALMDTDDEE